MRQSWFTWSKAAGIGVAAVVFAYGIPLLLTTWNVQPVEAQESRIVLSEVPGPTGPTGPVGPTGPAGGDQDSRVQLVWYAPSDADQFTVRLPPWTGAISRVDCEAYGGVSFTIKVCDGEDRGDDDCTSNILDVTELDPSVTLTCTTAGASDTSVGFTDFVARDKVTVLVTDVDGAVTQAEVYISAGPS